MKKSVVLVLLLAGCAIGPTVKDSPATYDLGRTRLSANATVPQNHATLLMYDVTAPEWLAGTDILYRLDYQNATRQQAYATSKWVAAPTVLLTQRLRTRLMTETSGGIVSLNDASRADYALHVELEDFSQIFETASTSHVSIVARASLVNVNSHALQSQKVFNINRAAGSADAEGGVRAFAEASDQLIDAIATWVAANLPKT